MHISHPMHISQDQDDKQEYIWERRVEQIQRLKDQAFCKLVEISLGETETAWPCIDWDLAQIQTREL